MRGCPFHCLVWNSSCPSGASKDWPLHPLKHFIVSWKGARTKDPILSEMEQDSMFVLFPVLPGLKVTTPLTISSWSYLFVSCKGNLFSKFLRVWIYLLHSLEGLAQPCPEALRFVFHQFEPQNIKEFQQWLGYYLSFEWSDEEKLNYETTWTAIRPQNHFRSVLVSSPVSLMAAKKSQPVFSKQRITQFPHLLHFESNANVCLRIEN